MVMPFWWVFFSTATANTRYDRAFLVEVIAIVDIHKGELPCVWVTFRGYTELSQDVFDFSWKSSDSEHCREFFAVMLTLM